MNYLKVCEIIGLALVLGVSLVGCGAGSEKWKEEVQLSDGKVIVIERELVLEAGGDLLLSGAGDDMLDGGSGADSLFGGDGQDSYLMHFGMGFDTLEDGANGELNTINLQGITLKNLAYLRGGNDNANRVENFKFAEQKRNITKTSNDNDWRIAA
jgi:Ca2+-binding RTX toxin-like protein